MRDIVPFPGGFERPNSRIVRLANDAWVKESALGRLELYSLTMNYFFEIESVFSFPMIDCVVDCGVTGGQRNRRHYKN